MKHILLCCLFYCISQTYVLAQVKNNTAGEKTNFVLGETRQFYSALLKEKRTLNVYLPDQYAKKDTVYPVIYLLDGSANEDFVHVVGIVQFLTMIEAMPPTIVVGIANVDRRRDFTFPTSIEKDKKAYPTTGASLNFISFIEKELQPFVEKNYKTSADKIIIGQSLGGLLATEILLKKPALFNRYVIVSPSLWWNDESLLKQSATLLNNGNLAGKEVYIAVGNEGKQMEDDAKQLSTILQNNASLKTSFVQMPEENHLTILHNCVYQVLKTLYLKKN